MFEFLFKRPGDGKSDGKPGGQPDAKGGAGADGNEPAASAAAPARALQAERLSQLGGDEAAAVEFILQCEFSALLPPSSSIRRTRSSACTRPCATPTAASPS